MPNGASANAPRASGCAASAATIRARGGRVAPTMNTLQIHRENATPENEEALSQLRALYLPVRYGERAASPEDVRRARTACERLKKV